MRTKPLPFVLLILVLLTGFSSRATAQIDGPSSADVQAREIAFAATMANRDLASFVSFLAPDAVFFDGNTPLRGRDTIREHWARLFEDDVAPFSWSPDVVQVLDSGNLAFSSGSVMAASGDVIGRFNSIWRKDGDGQWRVVFDKGS